MFMKTKLNEDVTKWVLSLSGEERAALQALCALIEGVR
jgi:hypothetical protein